jgi:hypothetical protein
MADSFDSALFSLTGSVEAVRETMRTVNLGKPLIAKNQPIINLEKEASGIITLLTEANDIYIDKLNSTNALVAKLIADLELIQNELIIERQYTKTLKAQLDAQMTGNLGI